MAWRETCGCILVALVAIGCATQKPESVTNAEETTPAAPEEVARDAQYPADTGPEDHGPMFDTELDRLADELASYIEVEIVHERERKTRVAIIPFVVDGEVTNFSKLLADELYTRLFRTGKFVLVEREKIDAVLEEQQFGSTALADERTVASLGKVVGAEALCMGSAMTYGDEYRINAKLISVERSAAIGVASTRVKKSGEETAAEPGGDEPGGEEPGGDEPGDDEPGDDEPGDDGE